jgi:lipoprotein-anchoring transpeptidase ErfK/SrfK
VRRAALLLALVACAFAGVLSAFLLSAPNAGADDGTTGPTATIVTETTATTTSPTEPTDTAPTTVTTTAPAPPQPKLIAAGVTIGGTLVGGLTPAEAREVMQAKFRRSLTLVVSPTRRIRISPHDLGAAAHLGAAVKRAGRVRRAGINVALKVDVSRSRLERYVHELGRELHRDPVDARLVLRKLKPFATEAVPGRRLKERVAAWRIDNALRGHDRTPVELPFDEPKPKVTSADFKDVIVIRRESRRLFLYKKLALKRSFRVATGQSSYPTPLGSYEIVTKQRNPWWYPPQGSAWAEGAKPIPPGPGNPLGTRWMGISAPYVGIHGTPDAASIGYSASHGCVRMLIPEVEWLFSHVEVGTPVFVVPA